VPQMSPEMVAQKVAQKVAHPENVTAQKPPTDLLGQDSCVGIKQSESHIND
jgi:hypothetical protein